MYEALSFLVYPAGASASAFELPRELAEILCAARSALIVVGSLHSALLEP